MDLLREVRRTIQRYRLINPGDTVVVGVSGGPDSLCLLHVLAALMPGLTVRLHVAHLHHGLRGADADADAAFVAEIAAAWGLPCTVQQADVAALANQTGASLEEAAREARYMFLGRLAGEISAQAVAVGHNADDQAETVLMHFLRGSGLAGLRGMQPRSPFPVPKLTIVNCQLSIVNCQLSIVNLRLIRPLLLVPRTDVLQYCAEHGLTPHYDRSNEDTTFFRNRLRHELLPLLESYNPQIRRTLANTAAVLADDYELLRGNLLATWPDVVTQKGGGRLVVDLAAWRGLPIALQRSVLREAIHRLRASLRNVNFVHVDNALWLLREGVAGDRMTLPAGLELVLGYDRFAMGDEGIELPVNDLPQMDVEWLPLPVPGTLDLGGWQVEMTLLDPANLPLGWTENTDPWQAWLDADALGPTPALRTWCEGDRFQPLGMAGRSKLLAELFTNVKIPAPARQRWPLLTTSAGDIAWVCGLRVDERAGITATTQQVLHVRLSRTA
jgi:tRNA(Ile)-lysidine synthetase-like protein